MLRRRRRPKGEIPFSFDSFLDVVANVVGIIIRLILVAWVGARTYKATVPLPPPLPPPASLAEPDQPPDPTDPRLEQIARRREKLKYERDERLERERKEEGQAHDEADRVRRELAEVTARRDDLEREKGELTGTAGEKGERVKKLLLSIEELEKRSAALMAEVKKANLPVEPKNKLRYSAPVSAVVQTDEVMFECKAGRVTLLDTAALNAQIEIETRRRSQELRERGLLSDVTRPVGAFRLSYEVERVRSYMGSADGSFRYAISWQAEPLAELRGEPVEKALAEGSEFRRIVDEIDPRQTVVTLWVYGDSFGLYRKLRDYMHGRELVVAGRPLPAGARIGCGPKGTASRGQ